MKKTSSIKLFLLLQAVFFAVAASVPPKVPSPVIPELPLVLVAKVNYIHHPLSIIPDESSDNNDIKLAWGDSFGAPVEFIKQKDNSLLSTNVYENGYVSLQENSLVLSKKKEKKTFFEFNYASLLINQNFFSCLKDNKYNGLFKDIFRQSVCLRAEIYLLPFDKKTRMVDIPVRGKSVKMSTSLTVPEGPQLGLFAKIKNTWHPITTKLSTSIEQLPNLYIDEPLRYPFQFEVKNKELRSVIDGITRYPCLGELFLSLENTCSTKLTLNENNVVNEKMYNCKRSKRLLMSQVINPNECEPVEVHLYYYDKMTNAPILDMPVDPPLDKASSGASTQLNNGGKQVIDAPNSQDTSDLPDLPKVFAVKRSTSDTYTLLYPMENGDITYLGFKQDEGSKNPVFEKPLEFEYHNGKASVKNSHPPKALTLENFYVTVKTEFATFFTVNDEGKVEKPFFVCHQEQTGDSQVKPWYSLCTNKPPNLNICVETEVYLLPYDRETRSIVSNRKTTLPTSDYLPEVQILMKQKPKQDSGKAQESGESTQDANEHEGHEEKEVSDNKQTEFPVSGQHNIGTNNLDVESAQVPTSEVSTPATEQKTEDQANNSDGSKGPVDQSKEKSNVKPTHKDPVENHESPSAHGNKLNVPSVADSKDKNVEENLTVNNPVAIEDPDKVDEPVATEDHVDKNHIKPAFEGQENSEAGPGNVTGISNPTNPRIEVSGTHIKNSGMEVRTSLSKINGAETNGTEKNDTEQKQGATESDTNVSEPKQEKSKKKMRPSKSKSKSKSNSNAPEPEKEKSDLNLDSSEPKKSSSKDTKLAGVPFSTLKESNKSNVSVPSTLNAQGITEDTKECTTNCNEEKKSLDTLNGNTLNRDKSIDTLTGSSTTSAQAIPTATVCNECEHGSHTTVWKTYTDYTTYCPQATTVTITMCGAACVPSTMTVAAAATLTVTGKCIVPETTTVGHTSKKQSEVKGEVKGEAHGQEKVKGEAHGQEKVTGEAHGQEKVTGEAHGQEKVKGEAHGQEKVKGETHGQKESFGQKEAFKPSQPKTSKLSQPKSSELKTDNAKGIEKSGTSGNDGKPGNVGTSQKIGTSQKNASNSTQKPIIAPVVNAASKNVLSACIAVGFASFLL